MNPHSKTCSHCGAKMVEYRHSMSALLVRCLQVAWLESRCGTRPFHVSNNKAFGYSEASNFQKLKYWGFIEHTGQVEGDWILTLKARLFLEGARAVKSVWTYRGHVLNRLDSPIKTVTINDIDPDWQLPTRKEYVEGAVRHENENQLQMVF